MQPTHRDCGVATIGIDPEALERFYREHVASVQRFVARRVSSPHLAADLTAEVFLAAIDSAAGYRSDLGHPRAWLFGIARNTLAMHVRREVRESRAIGRIQGRRLLDPDAIERAIERIDAERESRDLLRALDDLDEGQRAVVELVAVDGLTAAEAGAVLGLSSGAVRVRLHRARARLRAHVHIPKPMHTEVTS